MQYRENIGQNTKIIPLPNERECTAILGENHEVTGYITRTKRNTLGKGWVAMFQQGMEWLAKQGLTGEQWSVFGYLVSRLDFDNYLKVTQADIAKELDMQKSHVSRAIHGLIEHDVIVVGPMAGHSKTYRLNPHIAHKGTRNFKETVIEYDRLKEQAEKRRAEESDQ